MAWSLGDVELEGLAPVGIVAAAEAILDGKTAAGGALFTAALRADQRPVKAGPREIPIEVRNGAARLQAFTVETAEGAPPSRRPPTSACSSSTANGASSLPPRPAARAPAAIAPRCLPSRSTSGRCATFTSLSRGSPAGRSSASWRCGAWSARWRSSSGFAKATRSGCGRSGFAGTTRIGCVRSGSGRSVRTGRGPAAGPCAAATSAIPGGGGWQSTITPGRRAPRDDPRCGAAACRGGEPDAGDARATACATSDAGPLSERRDLAPGFTEVRRAASRQASYASGPGDASARRR